MCCLHQSDVFYGHFPASWGSDDALVPQLRTSGFHGDADAWLDLVNLYGPAMTAKECLTAYQSLSKMIAISPTARSQHKLPIFRSGHSILHRCFFKSLVHASGGHQSQGLSILDQAKWGMERSDVSLLDAGVVLVSIAATQERNRPFQAASSAMCLAWVMSRYALEYLQADHGMSSDGLMHWFLHPLSKIFGIKMDLSSPSSPWKQIILMFTSRGQLSLALSKSILEVYDRCKQLPPSSVLSAVYESCKQSTINSIHDANTLSSLTWFIARTTQDIKGNNSLLLPDHECLDQMLTSLVPYLPHIRGLPAKITPVLLLIDHQEPPRPAICLFIDSYYDAMHSFLSARTEDEVTVHSRHQAMRASGAKEEEAKARLYDLTQAALALPALLKLPSRLQPRRSDYVSLLLDAVLSSLRQFLHLLSLRSRNNSSTFVPASLLDVVVTACQIRTYCRLKPQWFKECCELSRPALSRVTSLKTFADLSEGASTMAPMVLLSSRWQDEFCMGVERLLSTPQTVVAHNDLRAVGRFVESLSPSLPSKRCLEAIKQQSSNKLVSSPSSPELKSLINQLARPPNNNTVLLVEKFLNLVLDDDSHAESGASVHNVARGVGIAIKTLSELRTQEPPSTTIGITPGLLLRLLSLASCLAPHMSFSQISQALLFSSRLCSSDDMLFWLQSASSSIAQLLTQPSEGDRIRVRDVSMVLQATSRLKHRNDPLWMDSLLDSILPQLSDAQPAEVVVLLSSLAYQKYLPCPIWTEAALSSAKNHMDQGSYQTRELASIGASLQALSLRPDFSWACSYVEASQKSLGSVEHVMSCHVMSPHSLIDHLTTLSFLLDVNPIHESNAEEVSLRGRSQSVASRLVAPSLIPHLSHGDLIRALEAIWKLHLVPNPDLIRAILAESADEMISNSPLPNHLVMSIWQLLAYAKIRPSDEWIRVFSAWSETRFPTSDVNESSIELFTPLHLAKILHSIARLGLDIKLFGSSWLTQCKRGISHLLPLMKLSLRSQVAWSIARTGMDKRDRLMCQIARTTQMTSSAASSQEDREMMRPSQAANILWSMNKSGYSPPQDYVEGLLSLFQPLLAPRDHPQSSSSPRDEEMTPRLLSLLSSSLAALRYEPKDPSFTQALMHQCLMMRQSMGPQSLALSLRSLVTLNGHQASEDWLVGMIESCVESADSFNVDEASMICMALTECCPPKRPSVLGITHQNQLAVASTSMTVPAPQQLGRPVLLKPPSKAPRQLDPRSTANRRSKLQGALISLSSAFDKKFTGIKIISEKCLILTDISTVV